MTQDTMRPVDRATLGAWRLGNIVGWSLGALVVAVATNFAARILIDDVMDAALDPLTGGTVVPESVGTLLSAVLVGTALGAVIGSRVWTRPVLVSVVVALFFVALWPFAVVASGSSGPWMAALSIAHLACAGVASHLLSRRRLALTSEANAG